MKKILKIFNNLLFIILPLLIIITNFKIDLTAIYKNSSNIILLVIYILFIIFEIRNLFNLRSINYDRNYNIVIFIFNITIILISLIYHYLSSIYFAVFYFPLFKQSLTLMFLLIILIILYKSLVNSKGLIYDNLFFMLSWIFLFNKTINNCALGLIILFIFIIIYLIGFKKKDGILYSGEYNALIKRYNVIFILYVFIYQILISLFYNIGSIINKIFIVISTIFLCLIVLTFIKSIKKTYLRRALCVIYYLIIILTIILGMFVYITTYF